jgi:hypothetical protein
MLKQVLALLTVFGAAQLVATGVDAKAAAEDATKVTNKDAPTADKKEESADKDAAAPVAADKK